MQAGGADRARLKDASIEAARNDLKATRQTRLQGVTSSQADAEVRRIDAKLRLLDHMPADCIRFIEEPTRMAGACASHLLLHMHFYMSDTSSPGRLPQSSKSSAKKSPSSALRICARGAREKKAPFTTWRPA